MKRDSFELKRNMKMGVIVAAYLKNHFTRQLNDNMSDVSLLYFLKHVNFLTSLIS